MPYARMIVIPEYHWQESGPRWSLHTGYIHRWKDLFKHVNHLLDEVPGSVAAHRTWKTGTDVPPINPPSAPLELAARNEAHAQQTSAPQTEAHSPTVALEALETRSERSLGIINSLFRRKRP